MRIGRGIRSDRKFGGLIRDQTYREQLPLSLGAILALKQGQDPQDRDFPAFLGYTHVRVYRNQL